MEVNSTERRGTIPLNEIDPQQISESLKDWKFTGSGSSAHNTREWLFELISNTERIDLHVKEKINIEVDETSHFEIDVRILDLKDPRRDEFKGLIVDRVFCDANGVEFRRGDRIEKDFTSLRVDNNGHIDLRIEGKGLRDFSLTRESKEEIRQRAQNRLVKAREQSLR